MRLRLAMVSSASVIAALALCAAGLALQTISRNSGADWPTYNRDLAGTRYSPLTQINTTNVASLKQVWSYRLRPEPGVDVPAVSQPASAADVFQEVTPIVVNGVM